MNVACLLADHFWMRKHLVLSWEAIASTCSVFYYQWDSWRTPDWRQTRERQGDLFVDWLAEQHDKQKVDILFCMVYDDFMTPELAQKIRTFGIPMVNYHVDMQHQWYRVLRSAPYFDLLCCAQREYMEVLSRYVDTAFVPMASNPRYFRPMDVPKSIDVIFVGNYNQERERVVAAAWDVTKNIIVYGSGWEQRSEFKPRIIPRLRLHRIDKLINDLRFYLVPRLADEGAARVLRTRFYKPRLPKEGVKYKGPLGGKIPDSDFVSVVSMARVALGINQRFGAIGRRDDAQPGFISGRLRDFEMPSCGVMYLAQRYPELEIYYKEGEEIEGWSTLEEMQRKLEYYLTHEDRRVRIAQHGRERVLRDHTWDVRFTHILHRLQFIPAEGHI